mmetsp:Transcript_5472/g.11296  ORF Transcript_5472/g.11296 Transcript_5472/m.11296 type:complete len:108 (-) Transcript_5472:340-663(-)
MRSYATFLCIFLYSAGCVGAFTVPQSTVGSTSTAQSINHSFFVLNMAPKDPSRSGSKTDRMEKLAEMERMGSANTDNSVFIQAAGAFAALIVVAIAAAASSGLLTQY